MYSLDKSGDDDAVDTPLPIPNREVKHCSGEGSRNARITRCRAFFYEKRNLLFNCKDLHKFSENADFV